MEAILIAWNRAFLGNSSRRKRGEGAISGGCHERVGEDTAACGLCLGARARGGGGWVESCGVPAIQGCTVLLKTPSMVSGFENRTPCPCRSYAQLWIFMDIHSPQSTVYTKYTTTTIMRGLLIAQCWVRGRRPHQTETQRRGL